MTDYQKITYGGTMPEGDWRRCSLLCSVAGIQHRRSAAESFARLAFSNEAQGRPFGLTVEREPSNRHDPNALKIVGWAETAGFLGGDKRKSQHIGYVDAMEARRASERFPGTSLAAEFYSLYEGRDGYLDVRFFLCVPEDAVGLGTESLLDRIREELLVLIYAARADNKLGRFEHDILTRFAEERAKDLSLPLDEQDIRDIRAWCRDQAPTGSEVDAAIDLLAERNIAGLSGLWEMVEIVITIDKKIAKAEREVAKEIASYIDKARNARISSD